MFGVKLLLCDLGRQILLWSKLDFNAHTFFLAWSKWVLFLLFLVISHNFRIYIGRFMHIPFCQLNLPVNLQRKGRNQNYWQNHLQGESEMQKILDITIFLLAFFFFRFLSLFPLLCFFNYYEFFFSAFKNLVVERVLLGSN